MKKKYILSWRKYNLNTAGKCGILKLIFQAKRITCMNICREVRETENEEMCLGGNTRKEKLTAAVKSKENR